MPLPYVHSSIPILIHRKQYQRHYKRTAIDSCTNRVINSINQPYKYPPFEFSDSEINTYKQLYNNNYIFTNNKQDQVSSMCQQRCIEHIRHACTYYMNQLNEASCSGLLTQNASDSNIIVEQRYTQNGYYNTEPSTTALPIIADRVALPNTINIIPITNLLPADVAALYQTYNNNIVLNKQQYTELINTSKRVKTARILGEPTEYIKLIKRMYDVGMIAFHTTAVAVNGIFCVHKSDTTLRCIIDARIANQHFSIPPDVALPTPSNLASLHISPTDTMYMGKMDLSNFYHHLGLPTWMQPYFALPPVPVADIDINLIQQYGDTKLYPCCTTLPMGFSHAVYIAQQVHNNVLYRSSALNPAHNILNITVPTLTTPVHMLYIDDNAIIGVNKQQVQEQYIKCITAYHQALLQVKPEKCTETTSEPIQVLGVMIGTHTIDTSSVSIKQHRIAPAIDKLYILLSNTINILSQQYVTGTELSKLIGHWTWISLLRRPVLMILGNVYSYIHEYQYHTTVTLPSNVRHELYRLIGIAPLIYADVSKPFADTLYATDASMTGNGVVATNMNNVLFNQLWPLTQLKQHDHRHNDVLNTTYATFNHHMFRTIVSSSWKYNTNQTHINQLELQSVYTMLRHQIGCTNGTDLRQLHLVDSSVTFYCLRKGRTSSYMLRGIVCKLSAHMLASGIVLLPIWIETQYNPADQASRTII